MKCVAAVACVATLGVANAFVTPIVPLRAGNVVARAQDTGLTMKLGDYASTLVGSDLEFPAFDPLNLSAGKDAKTVDRYRSCELKHGRLAMLAALGQLIQSFYHLPDSVFTETDKPWGALLKVTAERPEAVAQIALFVIAAEYLGNQNELKTGEPGNMGFDPFKLRATDPDIWASQQLRELKNGRLAMIAIAGMLAQENLTGLGVIEAYRENAVNPFGDGLGAF